MQNGAVAVGWDAISNETGSPRRRRRASLRPVRRRKRLRLPSVFSSLLLLGAAGLITTAGIYLASRYVGPQAPRSLAGQGAAAGAATPSPATATPSPAATPTPTEVPHPPAQVYLLPTPTPGPAAWCTAILGWSQTLTDHLCPTG